MRRGLPDQLNQVYRRFGIYQGLITATTRLTCCGVNDASLECRPRPGDAFGVIRPSTVDSEPVHVTRRTQHTGSLILPTEYA